LAGAVPQTPLGELTALPNTLDGFKGGEGTYFYGEGEERSPPNLKTKFCTWLH